MDFVNSTYYAAATLLPKALAKSQVLEHADLVPFVVFSSPWTAFNHVWTSVTGFDATNFAFIPGKTYMSTLDESAIAIGLYYTTIFGSREIMRKRSAFKLHSLFIIHNFYLTIISAVLLLLFIEQLVPSLWKHGLYANICGTAGWNKHLVVLYYLNYLTKYLELLDTVFLVLKKKPLTFLHTYHHGATALLCYTQLVGQTSVSWVPITLNLTVHVVMYWYYYQAARGVRVWWKQYITMLQISQFVLDLGFIYFATYTYYAHTYAPALPHMGSCGETRQEFAAFTGCAILSSYLLLFILFYLSTYKNPSAVRAVAKVSQIEVPTVAESTDKAAVALHAISTAIVETVKQDKSNDTP